MTTCLKISDDDRSHAALAAYIASIEARSSARKITAPNPTFVIAAAEARPTRLEPPKSAWLGTRCVCSDGGIRNIPLNGRDKARLSASSIARIERGSNCWNLACADRYDLWSNAREAAALLLAQAEHDEAIRLSNPNQKRLLIRRRAGSREISMRLYLSKFP
jgi:hypothetical protein